MPFESNLVAAGVASATAKSMLGVDKATVVAAGTTQVTAPQAPAADYITVASGTGGVILPVTNGAAAYVTVLNNSGASVNVYPQVGGQLNNFSVNAGSSISNGSTALCTTADGIWWFVQRA